MRRRLLVFAVLVIALVAVVAAGYWAIAPAQRLGRAGYERVQLGMTEAEVEDVLGAPPGSHLDLPEGQTVSYVHAGAESKGARDGPKGLSWVSNTGHIGVTFGADGRVTGVAFTPLRRNNPTWLDRVREWLAP